MKRIFSSPDSAEVGLLKSILERAGIRCQEINEQMAHTIPISPFQAELWVVNEPDYLDVSALLAEWLKPTHSAGMSWSCPRCGERLGSQFIKCCKCGARRKDGGWTSFPGENLTTTNSTPWGWCES
jgi:hypothetical protein